MANAQCRQSSRLCPPDHIWNNWNNGCLKLCSHPDFKNCGDAFPAYFNLNILCSIKKSYME